ncbi:MAG TPA: class I SAM-dependent methyltransferase [Bryobacteraceae bacterium]|nr:class I SAM-dependent methyltransferase [Bryobacteraceae bacterium]
MGFYYEHILPHLISLGMKNRRLAPYRERIVSQAEGRVLEIGIGSGLNLPFYSNRATEVLGLDPHPKLLAMVSQRQRPAPVELIEGSAESIPLDDGSVDTVVTTWTLCSVPDARKALGEMRRVLRPGGRLLLVEHGLAPDEQVRKWQHRLTPAWKRIAGGCHLDRPIPDLVQAAGFQIVQLQTGYMPGPRPMTFMYEAVASAA